MFARLVAAKGESHEKILSRSRFQLAWITARASGSVAKGKRVPTAGLQVTSMWCFLSRNTSFLSGKKIMFTAPFLSAFRRLPWVLKSKCPPWMVRRHLRFRKVLKAEAYSGFGAKEYQV